MLAPGAQEPCQEVLPWDGVPCPAAGRERTRFPLPPAACRVLVWMEESMVLPAAMAFSHPHPHLDVCGVCSVTCLLVGAEGMCITALGNAACTDPCSVLPVCCYQWSLLPISCPSPGLGISFPALPSVVDEESSAVRGDCALPGRPRQSWD